MEKAKVCERARLFGPKDGSPIPVTLLRAAEVECTGSGNNNTFYILTGLLLLSLPLFWLPYAFIAVFLLFWYSVWRNLNRNKKRTTVYCATTEEDVAVPPGTPAKHQNVCVIGAGPSGLVVTKELLDEGHEVTCFEKFHDIGGVFLYSPEKGGVYDNTLLTISNYLMAFSDYFKIGDSSKYWHHTEYFDYLKGYVENFQLLKKARFHFNTKVASIKREGNKWAVTTEGAINGTQLYDAVAICSGTHQKPNIPVYPGQESSPIKIVHSESYKRARGDPRFDGKRVVCVGGGETGADVSAEIAEVASKAWISLRRTPYVVPRNIWALGNPADTYSTRAMFYVNHLYIQALHNTDLFFKYITGKSALGQKLFNGSMGLGDPVQAKVSELAFKSGGGVAHQFLTKNDAFCVKLVDGSLVEKPGIQRLEGRTVHFTDGSKEENVDTIMLCTGYRDDFPFLDSTIKVDAIRSLYKHAFHPDIGPSLAWVGFVRPGTGGVPACSEVLARYWALLLSNKRKLPDDWKERTLKEKAVEENLIYLGHVKTLVFWGDYMESLGNHIGCQPILIRQFFKNPFLWARLYYGSLVPFQFRLRGPHAKREFAEKVISYLNLGLPLPFAFALTVGSIFSWISGSVASVLPTSW